MKKIYVLSALIIATVAMQAQTVLNYQTHGLVNDTRNEMFITKYVEPGLEGNNVVWDFSSLELTNNFVGVLDNPALSKGAATFTNSNVALEEFGNFFYFNANDQRIEQHGFMSGNGNIYIVYNVPFVKMRYPFAFGSTYSGPFGGYYLHNGNRIGDIEGTYTVTGDGMGKLLLPGNVSYNKALRVKEVKTFIQSMNGTNYQFEDVTYRWYVEGHRYPLLVLIKSTTQYTNGKNHSSTRAAYNPVILQNNPLVTNNLANVSSISAYPNPYTDHVNISVVLSKSSRVKLSVFDINGRLVKELASGVEPMGERNYRFSAKEMGLTAGTYMVKLNIDGKESVQKIVEL